MLSLALFAIIGALINAPTYFWIIYGIACSIWLISSVLKLAKKWAELENKL